MRPRVGFIGCGSFSSACLYPSLRLLALGHEPFGSEPIVDLVACCDLNESRAEANARAFGFARFYTDHREMLEREQLDAVLVVMHPRLQPTLAIEVMQSGANVFIEKPPAQTLGEVRSIQRVSCQTGRFCQVGFMKRFSTPYVKAKALIQREDFGGTSVYESRKARSAPYPPVYDFLNDFVCHHIDLARYFMGDVEYVYAELTSRTHDPENLNAAILEQANVYTDWPALLQAMPHVPQRDGYLITFRFMNQAIGIHNANTLETESNLLERVTVTGDGAIVAVEDWFRLRANIRDCDPIVWEPLLIDKDMNHRLSHAGYLGEIREFIDATKEKRSPSVTIDDGVACLEIVAAVRRSIAEGRRVSLDEIRAS
jgi:predicted dehydrogenase